MDKQWLYKWFVQSDIIEIPAGARFKAKIGFIKDATGTDGAQFRVGILDTSGIWHRKLKTFIF
jgi:hypothetical protein